MTEYNVGRISKVLCNGVEVEKRQYHYSMLFDTKEDMDHIDELNGEVRTALNQVRVGERCYSLDPKYERIYGTIEEEYPETFVVRFDTPPKVGCEVYIE